jgi:hypothetical protein
MKQAEYQMIADNIRTSLNMIITGGDHVFYARHYAFDLAHRFADHLSEQDESFNEQQFIADCGL